MDVGVEPNIDAERPAVSMMPWVIASGPHDPGERR